jgi:hypothetical protein
MALADWKFYAERITQKLLPLKPKPALPHAQN